LAFSWLWSSIEENGKSLHHNELLKITKYNLSNITLQYREINLTRLPERLIYEFQSLFAQKDLTCSLDATDDILLQCDADKIQRV